MVKFILGEDKDDMDFTFYSLLFLPIDQDSGESMGKAARTKLRADNLVI